MISNLRKTLETNKIQVVKTRLPVCVQKMDPLDKVLALMRKKKRGCAIIQDKKKMVGIFTERDLLSRVIEPAIPLSTPIEKVMTPNPTSLKPENSILEAIQLMNKKRHRHIPLINSEGDIESFVSIRDILDYLSELYPHEVYNLPPKPDQITKEPEGA